MKKIFALLALLIVGAALLAGGGLLLVDSPMKTLESFAIRHADKLPLQYFGGKLFDQHCASCHDNPAMHAPSREALSGFSKETVMVALEFGKMQPMAAHLSKQERGLIAIYLAGTAETDEWIAAHMCTAPASADTTEFVANWGLGLRNQRFVPADKAGIDSDNVDGLELAWSLAFPKVTDMRSQPAIIGDTLYLGDKTGKLYAIDRRSGCIRAHTEVLSGIRSAITVATLNSGKKLLVFADSMASIFAVDPITLEVVWQEAAGITRGNVQNLELAWSLAFPRVSDMRSQPAVIGDILYFGDKTGKLYAIDRKSGCIHAHTEVLSGIRSAITVATLNDGSKLLVFADSMASIFAVDPDTLEFVWQEAARIYETSVITGSISFHDDRLFVPVSSYEVAVSGSPSHICCKSHGGVIALDANNGEQLWAWHATGQATLQGQNADGMDWYGPSGASVWSTPTIDIKRNRLYFGTGENLSHPATDTSDAIIALDMDSGEIAWRFQAIPDDVWNAACLNGGANCPENAGGDFDFGASVILADLPDSGEVLLAGQKSGDVFALNPDPASTEGEVLWQRRVSNAAIGPHLEQTTTNGGVHWGMALAGERLLVAAADPERERPGYDPRPGLHALNLADGEVLWHYPVERGCVIEEANRLKIGLENMRSGNTPELSELYRCSFYYGLSAALTVTPQLAFSAGLDGKIRAFDIVTGEVLWQTATAQPFEADNGVKGHGGAIDVSGQVIAGGWLYVQSGYSMFGQLPGNMLLAYKVAEQDQAVNP